MKWIIFLVVLFIGCTPPDQVGLGENSMDYINRSGNMKVEYLDYGYAQRIHYITESTYEYLEILTICDDGVVCYKGGNDGGGDMFCFRHRDLTDKYCNISQIRNNTGGYNDTEIFKAE